MQTERLTTSESLILDVVRITASAVVAFCHLTQPYFSTSWRDNTDVARGAVAIFFVLSGFVIRYVTTRRPENLRVFLGDRASRIYSVALPALCLTLLLDSISRAANPAFYNRFAADASYPLLRVSINLAFLGQLWRHGINPLSDNPYWSINYEVAYYVAYGFFFYLAGTRRVVALAVLALLEGPLVLFLGLLWLIGCVSHDLYQMWNASQKTGRNLNLILLGLLALAPLAFVLRPALHVSSAQAVFASFRQVLANNYFLTHYMTSKRISNLNFVFGLVWAVLFMKLLQLARPWSIQQDAPWVKAVRFISEGTYPLYLLHYPIYVLIAACIPYNHAKPLPKFFIFLLVLLPGILAGHPANLLKTKLRASFRRYSF